MRNDELIRFRVPSELKSEAQEFCDSNGVSVGAWLRALMKDSLEGKPRKRSAALTLSDGTTLTRR